MRSGKGKCPQCKEMIVVDLDAPEIRCPFCNALLKKSKKTVAEVRAEEEARIAAAKAREEANKAPEETPAATPVAEPAAYEEPKVVASVEEPKVEEPAVEEPVAAVVAEEPAAEEPAVEEPVDEIGISDEELAAMDEDIPEESSAETPIAEEPVDEIGISDEELAALDTPAEEPAMTVMPSVDDSISAEEPESEVPADDEEALGGGMKEIPVSDADEIPAEEIVDENPVPVADAPIAEDPAVEEATKETPVAAADSLPEEIEEPAPEAEPVAEEVVDEPAAEELAIDEPVAEEIPVEAPAEEIPVEAPAEEIPVEDTEIPVADTEIPVAVAAEEPVVEAPVEEPVAEELAIEEPAPEPQVEEAVVETPAEQPAEEAAADDYQLSDEDFLHAAALDVDVRSNNATTRGFVPPKTVTVRDNNGQIVKEEKSTESTAFYKKGVAVLMMILGILAAGVYFLYYQMMVDFSLIALVSGYQTMTGFSLISLISGDLAAKVADAMPVFGGDNFSMIVVAALFGLIALVSILGMTGKKGRVGFIFVLVADIVYALLTLWDIHGGMFFLSDELYAKVFEHIDYIIYGVYGLLLVGALCFGFSFRSGKEQYGISGGMLVLPLLFAFLVAIAYAVLPMIPVFLPEFVITDNMVRLAILGIYGVALLLTLVGVHSKTASRAANAWLIFGLIILSVCLYAGVAVYTHITTADDLNATILQMMTIPVYVTPMITCIGVIGLAASDLRN